MYLVICVTKNSYDERFWSTQQFTVLWKYNNKKGTGLCDRIIHLYLRDIHFLLVYNVLIKHGKYSLIIKWVGELTAE